MITRPALAILRYIIISTIVLVVRSIVCIVHTWPVFFFFLGGGGDKGAKISLLHSKYVMYYMYTKYD